MTIRSVLIVEPDPLAMTPLAAFLRDCGYTVLEAFDGKEAQQILASPDHPIDVVLTAIDLGSEPNGFVLAQWIRAHHPGVDVLLAGTIEKAANVAANLCDGHSPDFRRPYEPQVVVDRIRKLRLSGSNGSRNGDKDGKACDARVIVRSCGAA